MNSQEQDNTNPDNNTQNNADQVNHSHISSENFNESNDVNNKNINHHDNQENNDQTNNKTDHQKQVKKEKDSVLSEKLKKLETENKKVKELCKQLIEKQQNLQIAVANERRHLEFKLKSEQNKKVNKFIEEVIHKIHNFDLAIEISKDNKNIQSGIIMIKKQFLSLLKNYGVFEISSQVGDKFDGHLHEAVEQKPGNKDQHGTISKVISNGFIRNSDNNDKLNNQSVILKTVSVEMFVSQ